MTQKSPALTTEVLPAELTKGEARRIEGDAKRHLDGFTTNGFALAVDLRRLQDGAAHLLRGYPNFGEYIEATFKGQISGENAKKLSLQGRVLVALIDAKKIELDTARSTLGTTGARALSAVQTKKGTPNMLAVYDKAAQIARERGTVITDEIVAAVIQPQLPEPEPKPAREPAEEEPEYDEDYELTAAESALLELLGKVEEGCMVLRDEIESGDTAGPVAAGHIQALTQEAQTVAAAYAAALAALRTGS